MSEKSGSALTINDVTKENGEKLGSFCVHGTSGWWLERSFPGSRDKKFPGILWIHSGVCFSLGIHRYCKFWAISELHLPPHDPTMSLHPSGSIPFHRHLPVVPELGVFPAPGFPPGILHFGKQGNSPPKHRWDNHSLGNSLSQGLQCHFLPQAPLPRPAPCSSWTLHTLRVPPLLPLLTFSWVKLFPIPCAGSILVFPDPS